VRRSLLSHSISSALTVQAWPALLKSGRIISPGSMKEAWLGRPGKVRRGKGGEGRRIINPTSNLLWLPLSSLKEQGKIFKGLFQAPSWKSLWKRL
jgi:hypothetical protein